MDGWMRFAAQRKKLYFCAAGAAFALFLAAACFMGPRTYIITDGERVMTYSTFATDPSLVLSGAGVELDELDSFSADRSDIRICRSSRVLVWYHGQLHILTAGEETVELNEAEYGEMGQVDELAEHTVVNDKDLNDHRGRPEQFHIGGCQKCHGIEFADGHQQTASAQAAVFAVGQKTEGTDIGHAQQRQNDTQDETDDHGGGGQHHGNAKTPEDQLAVLEGDGEAFGGNKIIHEEILSDTHQIPPRQAGRNF